MKTSIFLLAAVLSMVTLTHAQTTNTSHAIVSSVNRIEAADSIAASSTVTIVTDTLAKQQSVSDESELSSKHNFTDIEFESWSIYHDYMTAFGSAAGDELRSRKRIGRKYAKVAYAIGPK